VTPAKAAPAAPAAKAAPVAKGAPVAKVDSEDSAAMAATAARGDTGKIRNVALGVVLRPSRAAPLLASPLIARGA
jgi:hypothetical protein